MTQTRMGNIIWATAEILRGDYKQADYGKVILPMTVARRLDGMASRRHDEVQAVLKEHGKTKNPYPNVDAASGQSRFPPFYESIPARADGLLRGLCSLSLRSHAVQGV